MEKKSERMTKKDEEKGTKINSELGEIKKR